MPKPLLLTGLYILYNMAHSRTRAYSYDCEEASSSTREFDVSLSQNLKLGMQLRT